MPERKSWMVSFDAQDRTGQRIREARQAQQEGQAPCSRGERCSGRRVRIENGQRIIIPAWTYQDFCASCTSLIGACLPELPPAYVRLHLEVSQPSQSTSAVRSPFGPRLPLRGDVDALMRSMCEILASWEERVRDVARLSPLDTASSRRRRQGPALVQSARILGLHLAALLALPSAPMIRAISVPGEPEAMSVLDLSGADAGLEILRLHRSALSVLGEIVARAEELEGVPCRECEEMTLVRAEPPSDPALPAMHSHCLRCRHQMDKAEFTAWARLYARWADSSGVSCRRCLGGLHGECRWDACSCRGCGHALAA